MAGTIQQTSCWPSLVRTSPATNGHTKPPLTSEPRSFVTVCLTARTQGGFFHAWGRCLQQPAGMFTHLAVGFESRPKFLGR